MTTPANKAALRSSATDAWPTPQSFFDTLNDEFGFTLDVCADSQNHKAPAYYALDHDDPARRDGLTGDWLTDARGGAIWMNPPYGRGITAWMAKAAKVARQGATIVCLIPARTDARWFHDFVLAEGAEVRFVRGRLKFGQATTSAPFANLVVVYRGLQDLPHEAEDLGSVRPQAQVKNILQLGNRRQVRPGAACQQVLDGGSRQVGTNAGLLDPDSTHRDPSAPRHQDGVGRGHRSIPPQPAVGEASLDVVGRHPGQAASSGHVPHATNLSTPPPATTPTPAPLRVAHVRSNLHPETEQTSNISSIQGVSDMPRQGIRAETASGVARLDTLTVHAISRLYRALGQVPSSTQVSGVHLLALAKNTVARHGGMGGTYRHSSVIQHLYATTTLYLRHFAPPHASWTLGSADPAEGWLRWSDGCRVVVDVLNTMGHLAPDRLHADDGAVVRVCNLADWRQSMLWSPGQTHPTGWAPALDPVRQTGAALGEAVPA